jgi:outer membrane protein TolC
MNSAAFFTLLLQASAALASASAALSEGSAVQQTIDHNPTLRAAVSDVRQSAESLRAEQLRYRPRLLLDATGSTQNTPNLDTSGGTNSQLSQSLLFGAELSQTFSWGTTVDLRLENRDTRSEGPLFSGSSDVFTLGPGISFGARLSLTQPLLRGFGNEVGLAALRSEQLGRKELERARDDTASQTLSTTLQAYWEVWYAQQALDIQREARTLVGQQRDETRRKVAAGSAAEVDLLSWDTRVAELDQNVLAAQVQLQQSSVELRRAMGLASAAASFDLSGAKLPKFEAYLPEESLAAAQEASYALLRQRLSLERAELALRSVDDSSRPRLDLQAWVQTQGLGNQSASGAFEQLGKFGNPSANVGLSFELPLSERHEAQLGSARLAVTAAQQRLEAARQQAVADTEVELATLSQATQNIALAQASAEVSSRSVAAQHKRLDSGSATALEVREAEDSLRRARLSVERERVNAIKAQVRLAHLTGNLLAQWGVVAADCLLLQAQVR